MHRITQLVSKTKRSHLKIPQVPLSKGDEFNPDFATLNSNLLKPLNRSNQWIAYKYSVHDYTHLKNAPRTMFRSILVYINASIFSIATCLDHIQSVIDDMQTLGYRPTENEFKSILLAFEKIGLFQNPKLLLNSVNNWGIKDWNHEFKGQSLVIFMTLLIKRAVFLGDRNLFRATVVYCHGYIIENDPDLVNLYTESDQQSLGLLNAEVVPGLFKELLVLLLDSSIALNVDILDIYQKCDRLKIDIPYSSFQKTVFHIQSLMHDPFGLLGELDDLLRPRKGRSSKNASTSRRMLRLKDSTLSVSNIQNEPEKLLNIPNATHKVLNTTLKAQPANSVENQEYTTMAGNTQKYQEENLKSEESTEMASLVRQLLQIFITKEYACPFLFKSLLLSCLFQKQFIEADILWSYSTLFKKQYIYKISISTEHVLIFTKTLLVQKRIDEVVHLYKRHFATMSVKRRRDSALHFIFLKFFLGNSHVVALDSDNIGPIMDEYGSLQPSAFGSQRLDLTTHYNNTPNLIARDYLENIEGMGIKFQLKEMVELRKLVDDEDSSEILSRMACSI
jgi:hypothetical protein